VVSERRDDDEESVQRFGLTDGSLLVIGEDIPDSTAPSTGDGREDAMVLDISSSSSSKEGTNLEVVLLPFGGVTINDTLSAEVARFPCGDYLPGGV
jgi:hypothetical protein